MQNVRILLCKCNTINCTIERFQFRKRFKWINKKKKMNWILIFNHVFFNKQSFGFAYVGTMWYIENSFLFICIRINIYCLIFVYFYFNYMSIHWKTFMFLALFILFSFETAGLSKKVQLLTFNDIFFFFILFFDPNMTGWSIHQLSEPYGNCL